MTTQDIERLKAILWKFNLEIKQPEVSSITENDKPVLDKSQIMNACLTLKTKQFDGLKPLRQKSTIQQIIEDKQRFYEQRLDQASSILLSSQIDTYDSQSSKNPYFRTQQQSTRSPLSSKQLINGLTQKFLKDEQQKRKENQRSLSGSKKSSRATSPRNQNQNKKFLSSLELRLNAIAQCKAVPQPHKNQQFINQQNSQILQCDEQLLSQ